MPEPSSPSDPFAAWRAWWESVGVRAPLSGDVTQTIEAALARAMANQVGLINISSQASGNPDLERQITDRVASYGRQLGRLLDAVEVLIRAADRRSLDDDDRRAIDELLAMRAEIEALKDRASSSRLDRTIAEIRALRSDPDGNAAALARLREELSS